MKREYKSYLIRLGNIVYQERQKLGMSQIAFYKFLFPDTNKEDENIKKKMNAIENAKILTIDYEFIFTLCNACNLSVDYLFKDETNYRNHENEFVCNYIGLSEETVELLHGLNEFAQSKVDLSLIKNGGVGEDAKKIDEAYKKNDSIKILKTINYLFTYREKEKYPGINEDKLPEVNLSILDNIYQYCMAQPEAFNGSISGVNNDLNLLYDHKGERVELDLNNVIFIKDSEETYYPINPKDFYKELAKENLIKNLDKLAAQYEMDSKNNFKGENAYHDFLATARKRKYDEFKKRSHH